MNQSDVCILDIISKGCVTQKWSDKHFSKVAAKYAAIKGIKESVSTAFWSSLPTHTSSSNEIRDVVLEGGMNWHTIGKGSFGVVYEYQPLNLAVKVVSGQHRKVKRELMGYKNAFDALGDFTSPYFCHLIMYDWVPVVQEKKQQKHKTNHTDYPMRAKKGDVATTKPTQVMLMFEKINGESLYHTILKTRVSPSRLQKYAVDIYWACQEMANNSLLHRDLYATNIIATKNSNDHIKNIKKNGRASVQIIDFGLSVRRPRKEIDVSHDFIPFLLNLVDTWVRKQLTLAMVDIPASRKTVTKLRLLRNAHNYVLKIFLQDGPFVKDTLSIMKLSCDERKDRLLPYISNYFPTPEHKLQHTLNYAIYFKYLNLPKKGFVYMKPPDAIASSISLSN